MLSIVYSSTATVDFSDRDLDGLLVSCRSNNERLGVTGVLAFREGRFLQLLEGPLEVVRERMKIIARDPRHTGVTTLLEEVTQKRQFPEWTMGFERVNDTHMETIPGYRATFDSLNPDTAAGGTTMALRQLLAWYEIRANSEA